MFGTSACAIENRVHLERVEGWTRQRFGLGADDLVLVSEGRRRRPGFPARQTTVLFWHGDLRHRFVVFAPVAELRQDDIPLAWLRPTLVDTGDTCC